VGLLTAFQLIKDRICSKAQCFGSPLLALGQLVCAGMSPQHIAQMLAAAASTWSEEFDIIERCPAQSRHQKPSAAPSAFLATFGLQDQYL